MKEEKINKSQSTEDQCVENNTNTDKKNEIDLERIEALLPEEIHQLIKKADEADDWKNKYLYATADLDNFRKRSAKERSNLIKYSGKNILYDLLEVVDNFDLAIKADKIESDPKVILQGIELISKQLHKVLESYGIKPVESKDKTFNPEIHEAMQKIPSDEVEPGNIISELQKGYYHKDKILRPARVIVAAEPEQLSEEETNQ